MRLKLLQVIISLAIGFLAVPAHSIGLGKLSANSELGQPLHITIPIKSVTPAQLEDLKVRLASAGVYAALGWPYPRSAGEMKFVVESYTDGEATIFITTDSKISQTILPLVIQVSWSGGGSLQREFTVLLDPPEYVVALTEANIVNPGTSVVSESEATAATDEITTTALEIPVTTTATTIAEPAESIPSQTGSNSRVEQALVNGVIEVIPGDSLSKIAEMFLQQGVTKYQTRVAFFDANPRAFANNDINLLMSGQRLTIPSAETIDSYSRDEAKQRYKNLLATPDASANSEVAESQATIENGIVESQTSDSSRSETPESAAAGSSTAESVTEESETVEPEIEEPATVDTAESGDNVSSGDQTASQDDEFGLQVLPVEGELLAATESSQTSEPDQSSESQKSQEELLDTFSMQGFSTRIKYMDAYLVELQDENQLLKDKISTLEQTVGMLVNFVPVEGLTPQQQAALETLREDFSGTEIASNVDDQDAVDVSDLTEFSAPEEVAGDDSNQQDSQSEIPAADQSDVQSSEIIETMEIKKSDTGNTELTKATVDQTNATQSIESELITASASTEPANNTVQEESGPTRVKIKGGWSTQLQGLVSKPFFLPGIALVALVLLWFRRKRIRDEAEVNERLKADPELKPGAESAEPDDSRPAPAQFAHAGKPGQGVTYLEPDEQDDNFLSDDIFSSEDVERRLEADIPEIEPETIDIDMPQDHKLDSVTEADVFMKYNRPDLAIQVLEDDYRSGAGNQGSIVLKLIDVHESLSGKTSTDTALKNFIQELYADVDKFDNITWEKISDRIDKVETS